MAKPLGIAENTIGLSVIGLSVFIGLGGIYWLWMSFQAGSTLMFLAGVLPPGVFVTAPLGAWSLLFGPPEWLGEHLSAAALV